MNHATASVSFREAFRFWVKLGFINFGGPAGQIAIMHRELVDRRQWLSEEQFLRALNFCMLLPGPEAQQLAVYAGARLHGTLGGVVAGTFFILPSVFVLLALSWLAVVYGTVPTVSALFYGIQCAVLGIVLEAVMRIGRRALRHPALYLFAAAAFVCIFVLGVNFPWIVLGAALAGAALQSRCPVIFHRGDPESSKTTSEAPANYPPVSRAVKIVLIFLLLWAIPAAAVLAWRGTDDVLWQETVFFTKAAFVTFGGAYAVLSYVADAAVNHFHWLSAREMVQGLGLAESTPGPLIMVLQYVGFFGAWNQAGAHDPLANAVLGALLTTYVTFLPSYMFIFVGSPYVEALAAQRRLQAALAGVTAAVVGVIANLAVFFARGVMFHPDGSLDYFALAIGSITFIVLLRFKVELYVLVPAAALAGLVWKLLG
jgi:chromate transporter